MKLYEKVGIPCSQCGSLVIAQHGLDFLHLIKRSCIIRRDCIDMSTFLCDTCFEAKYSTLNLKVDDFVIQDIVKHEGRALLCSYISTTEEMVQALVEGFSLYYDLDHKEDNRLIAVYQFKKSSGELPYDVERMTSYLKEYTYLSMFPPEWYMVDKYGMSNRLFNQGDFLIGYWPVKESEKSDE